MPSENGQSDAPVQPVEKPILCSPYEEPTEHWVYNDGEPSRQSGRREAFYWYKTERTGTKQKQMFAEDSRDDIPLVNRLRSDVRRWRESGYESATTVSKKLLRHWAREDLPLPLFFCQREAAETIIYIRELLASGKTPRFNTEVTLEDFQRLSNGERPSFAEEMTGALLPRLVDAPPREGWPALARYGCKMATGSGKTVVMAMVIAWSFCNRGRVPGDTRFPQAALVCCPNLTIKEQLERLRPGHPENYYEGFNLVPSDLRPELQKGKVEVLNWHVFLPEDSSKAFDGKTHRVVKKGEESPEAFARKRLGALSDEEGLMVFNDEAHHAYRPKSEEDKSKGEDKSSWEEATVWVQGLDKINKAQGIDFCMDLSATPFYLKGSGYVEGAPFPWLVSDFGLVDAIESGITKVPRLPAEDNTAAPKTKFFKLWERITSDLSSDQKLPGGKPKPSVVWERAQGALTTLMSQWKERFDYIREERHDQDTGHVPPVLIIVCDNTNIAELFYRKISGERLEENEEGEKEVRFGRSQSGFQEFANVYGRRHTVHIDSKKLEKAESRPDTPEDGAASEEERLRRIVATVGEKGKPGEHVRCLISVQMLSEGWDANNVTHILGLRAFGSQLLCEQVVGRGLRRIDYVPDPETKQLTEEYVDVYGVPFSVIPYKGRQPEASAGEDRPSTHVHAVEERSGHEIRFPVVESYVFDLKRGSIRADVGEMEKLVVDPGSEATSVFVKPQIGYDQGNPSLSGNFQFESHDREEYYEANHLQTIKFEIARQVTHALTTETKEHGEPRMRFGARHKIFPQVFALVEKYVASKVEYRGDCHPCELGLETYTQKVVSRLLSAIEPDEEEGEPPLLPVRNRYKQSGSTEAVNFKTTKPCFKTRHSHVNQAVADTQQWEQSAAFHLEKAAEEGAVESYVKNERLGFTIPYDHDGSDRSYRPDFIVRFPNGKKLVLEIKGIETEKDRSKHQAAKRWVSAVNNWGQMGQWDFEVCYDPQNLPNILDEVQGRTPSGAGQNDGQQVVGEMAFAGLDT